MKRFIFAALLLGVCCSAASAANLAVSLGIRETGGSGPIFSNGGSTNGIEFVNLDGQMLNANGTWQLFTFTPSTDTLTAFAGEFAAYVPMPWLRHHVLALGLSGAVAMGTYAARSSVYYTGGFVDETGFDSFASGIRQGGFVLRGYEPGQFSGTTFNLANLEYRFPISYVDRGLSTLPVFMRALTGVLFVDYGGAYDQMNLSNPLDVYHLGAGAELWVHLVIAYGAFVDVRLGFAKGFDEEAPEGVQTYFVFASGF